MIATRKYQQCVVATSVFKQRTEFASLFSVPQLCNDEKIVIKQSLKTPWLRHAPSVNLKKCNLFHFFDPSSDLTCHVAEEAYIKSNYMGWTWMSKLLYYIIFLILDIKWKLREEERSYNIHMPIVALTANTLGEAGKRWERQEWITIGASR